MRRRVEKLESEMSGQVDRFIVDIVEVKKLLKKKNMRGKEKKGRKNKEKEDHPQHEKIKIYTSE